MIPRVGRVDLRKRSVWPDTLPHLKKVRQAEAADILEEWD
jgi:hypothetical protein